jgi:hypothetical protein
MPTQYLSGHNLALWNLQNHAGVIDFSFYGFGGYSAYTNAYQQQAYYRGRGQYHQAYAQQPQACSQVIGQTCMVGTDSCGPRAFCRPVTPNQAVGVCAR